MSMCTYETYYHVGYSCMCVYSINCLCFSLSLLVGIFIFIRTYVYYLLNDKEF